MAESTALTQAAKTLNEIAITQRIRKITVTPQPNAVLLDFVTNIPTLPVIEIFRLVRDANGNLVFNPGESVGVLFDFLTGALFTEHHARVPGLAQDTSYSFRITAGADSRPAAIATGTFKTGRRSAKVVIREIQLYNDGDPTGSAEFSFAFGLYNEGDDRVDGASFAGDMNSGELFNLPFGPGPALSMSNAPDWVAVYSQGLDDDVYLGGPGLFGRIFGLDEPRLMNAQAPLRLPEEPSHQEEDNFVKADAFQRHQLPNASGDHRVQFSLNSGPWGVHFIVNGWIDVHVTNPPPTRIWSFEDFEHSSTTLLTRSGMLQTVRAEGGKAHLFGLGPDGVVAQLLPRTLRRSRPEWTLIPTGGAESATIIAHDERCASIVAVRRGTIRVARCALGTTLREPPEWVEIGTDMQPLLTTLTFDEGVFLLGLTNSGEVRAMSLGHGRSYSDRWLAFGGNFVGRVAALAVGGAIELFAVTPDGEVESTSFRPGAEGEQRWRSLGGERVSHVFAVGGEAETQLIALTHDRVLLSLPRDRTGFHGHWRVLGTLDELGREERSRGVEDPSEQRSTGKRSPSPKLRNGDERAAE